PRGGARGLSGHRRIRAAGHRVYRAAMGGALAADAGRPAGICRADGAGMVSVRATVVVCDGRSGSAEQSGGAGGGFDRARRGRAAVPRGIRTTRRTWPPGTPPWRRIPLIAASSSVAGFCQAGAAAGFTEASYQRERESDPDAKNDLG